MRLDDIRQCVASEMATVEEHILKHQYSPVELVNQVSNYIIGNGGKRLRPLVHVLTAKACGYDQHAHIDLATVLEYVHTATLLHDDVIDDSSLRRGHHTANTQWGNPASILVGDFLYSRAFQLMVGLEDLSILHVLAEATNMIAQGEVMQLMYRHNPNITQADYVKIIQSKTGKLFEVATHLAAIISRVPAPIANQLQQFGMHLGVAFQLIDDVLDYSVDAAQMGKNMGDDLAQGSPTLPLLYALWESPPGQSAIIREAIVQGGHSQLQEIQQAIESTQAIAYTINQAKQQAQKAYEQLKDLQPSVFKTALTDLIEFAIDRKH